MRRLNVTINHISSKNAFRKLLTASRPVYIKQDKVTVLLEKRNLVVENQHERYLGEKNEI